MACRRTDETRGVSHASEPTTTHYYLSIDNCFVIRFLLFGALFSQFVEPLCGAVAVLGVGGHVRSTQVLLRRNGVLSRMSGSADDIDRLRRLGEYENRDELLDDAVRSLLRRRPELRTELAVLKFREGVVSRNRAAEIAGLSTAEFSELLAERGVSTDPGFLDEDSRARKLDDS